MAGELKFDERVVIVTGAGNGLGRSHALLFASRGARVVVNDLGGSAAGSGQSASAADRVVAEIREAGGEAVANYDSVEDGAKIVQTAMDTWGRIDVVINNAGILRDVSFHKMTDDDWDLVYRVHVLGSYRVTRAAWPHMREQSYGRVVMTASAAGIYGNFGQSNYAMAKLGLTGLANSLAIEGHKRNVLVNTVAPIAGSRLTETVLPKHLTDALRPEYVSPLVALLAHESCEETGGLFEVGGGVFNKLRWERTKGKAFRIGRPITLEALAKSWPAVTSFENTTHPKDVTSSFGAVMENVARGPGKGGNRFIDVDEALGYAFAEHTSHYDARDLALYALGVGAGADPTDASDLQLVYERHGRGHRALPTYGVVPAINLALDMAQRGESAPGMNYGLDRVLHGEQYTRVVRPLPPEQTLTHKVRVKDIWDKGKGALVVSETHSYDEDGDLLVVNETTAFIRGAGGWGGERGPSGPVNEPPARAPDAVVEERIGVNQALLYRLSGDWNPLHVDPGFAKAFGFERPILHGLCTFGYAGRHVINAFCGGDPRTFKSIKVRFADSVYPGETLVTEMWKESDTRIVFRTRVPERDAVVLSNAAVELYEEIPEKQAKPAASALEAVAETVPAKATGPSSTAVFRAIGVYLAAHPELVGQIGVSYLFQLSEPASAWTMDLSSGEGSVTAGVSGKPTCTLKLSDADFLDMTSGKADPQKLYFGGQLKVEGDVMASQKLTFLQEVDPADVAAAVADAADDSAATEAVAVAPTRDAAAPGIFGRLSGRLADAPELAGEVAARIQFQVTEPDAAWVVDMRSGPGTVAQGSADDVDATLMVSDEDLQALVSGAAAAQDLFQRGRLRVLGDLSVAHRLGFLKGLA